MKKYIYILTLVIPAILFTSCTESDDEFFASKIVTANNLIDVNTTANDVTVSCNFARLLPQDTNPFDLYLTSTSEEFFFNYTLEKKNASGNWVTVPPTGFTTIVNNGTNIYGEFISAICQLDVLETNYQYETTITPSTPIIFSLQVFSSTPNPIYKGVLEYFLTFSIIFDKSSFCPLPVIPA